MSAAVIIRHRIPGAQRHAIRASRIECGIHHPTGIDNEQITWRKKFPDVTELSVYHAVARVSVR